MIIFVARQMTDVRNVSSHQIVDGNDAVSFGQQAIGQVRPKKTGTASYHRNGLSRGRHAGVIFLIQATLADEQFPLA